jgi:hypothetical protein
MAAAAILEAVDHSAFVTFEHSMFFLVCVSNFIKSGRNCPFYSIHFNFQNGGGGHLETWRTSPAFVISELGMLFLVCVSICIKIGW